MKNKFLLILCALGLHTAGQVITGVDTLLKSGPINKRINLVFMGDGYTTAQMTQFIANATSASYYLLNTTPFVYYKNYFNVFAIKCPSPQSGITHLGVATDVTEPASPTLNVTNNFDTRFDNYGVHRLIYSMDPAAVYSVLAAGFPAYDQAIILGNSTEYGGAGGGYAVSSIHPSSPEIVVHEMGHSFAGLADEYWAGASYAAEKPNMTANNNTSTIKWSPWVGSNSINAYPYDNTPPGDGWFRPHQNCKMQFLNAPFCSVCKQTIIERIHALTNPIDDYSPANNVPVTYTAPAQWFKITLVKPNPNTLKSSWELNGNLVASNVDSLMMGNVSLTPGNNSLWFTVTDSTILSRDSAHYNQHTYSVLWFVNFSQTVGVKEISAQMELSMFPNPASETLHLNYNLLSEAEIGISVTDMSGRTVLRERSRKEPAGEYKKQVDVSGLKEGNYLMTLKINEQIITNKFIITK